MIHFLKYRTICVIFSSLIFLTFLGFFAYKRTTLGQAFSYSVEFTGGTQILLQFEKPIAGAQVVDILEKKGWVGAVAREFGSQEVLVRIKEVSADIATVAETIRSTIENNLQDNKVQMLEINSIGQGVGEALSWNSVKAIVLGLILMLLYIAWRFWSMGYAVGAIVALIHDAVVIMLYLLLFNKEISGNIILAILTVLGYSINDTIVIFTRIRDNIRSMKGISLEQIIETSLNQTLRRTILTSLSTALVVISLIALGGEVLRDLSIALLIGIIFGTYSSIYIASPVMLLLYKR